ncbi:MAG: DNA-binding response regulator [Acidobacteria bacterium]|nr:MAG: DNA-binding response regulator [Acidobacteriota bacterium]
MIRILLVDDHEVVLRGISSMLATEDDFEVVGEAGTADEAIRQAAKLRPNVVIMDVRLPDKSGIEACRQIRADQPETRVLMLTSHADDDALFASIMAGADGYVLKQIRGGDLVGSIRKIDAGESLLDPSLTSRIMRRLRGEDKSDDEKLLEMLTGQERKILALIADGKTNRQIAEEIFLAEKTVKNYVSSMLSKLGMARRSEAAAFAARIEAVDAARESSNIEQTPENWP